MNRTPEKQYLDLLQKVLAYGTDRSDRTGTGTRSIFGATMRFNMEEGFPAITTKKLAFKAVKSELLWFLEGSTFDERLRELNGTDRTIWTANADEYHTRKRADGRLVDTFPAETGYLGPVYGKQWRRWDDPQHGRPHDQIAEAIRLIKEDPMSRRIIVNAWNVGQLNDMALPPCHVMFQFYVADGKLSLQMYQRSADLFLGVPFNIASYSLLLHMVAQVTGLKAGEFIHVLGDAHIYSNHRDAVKEQLTRDPLPLPTLWLNPDVSDINRFAMDDIRLDDYKSYGPIAAPMAV